MSDNNSDAQYLTKTGKLHYDAILASGGHFIVAWGGWWYFEVFTPAGIHYYSRIDRDGLPQATTFDEISTARIECLAARTRQPLHGRPVNHCR